MKKKQAQGKPPVPAVHSRGSLPYRAPNTNIYLDMVTENVDVPTYTVDQFGFSHATHGAARTRAGHGIARPDPFTVNFQPANRALDRSDPQ